MHVKVTNAYIAGRTLGEISEFLNRDMVCSRMLHDGQVTIPTRDTVFALDDELYIVCAEADAEAIQAFIGPELNRSEEHTSELQSRQYLVCRLLLEKKKTKSLT